MTSLQLGELTITRLLEREEPTFAPTRLLPRATPAALAPHRAWLEPRALDPATGMIVMPVMSWLVRTPRLNLLIDACLGEGKTCRWHAPWHRLHDLPFLADLAAAGVSPAAIDYVVNTHLHGDHVGWNTRQVGGHWQPTFPNARYLISARELHHWRISNQRGANHPDYEDGIDESVTPVLEAGQAFLVEGDEIIDDHVALLPLPGHTPGHFGVHLRSRGREAFMIGDLMHSPVQCAQPGWHAGSDHDPALATATRRQFLERHADSERLVLTAHFPSPSAGYLRRHRDEYRFVPVDE